MNSIKRMLAWALILALALACLSGCGGKKAEVEITVEPTPTAAPEPTPAAAEDTPAPDDAGASDKYAIAYAKHDPDEIAMLINGQEITWSKYFSWVYDVAQQMEQNGPIEDWDASCAPFNPYAGDLTYSQYISDIAVSYLAQVSTIISKAQAAGVTVKQEDEDNLQATLESYRTQLGGEEAFEAFLAEHYMTTEYLLEQNRSVLLLNGLYENMFGAGGSKLSEEDAINYLKDNGYYYAKHILFRTVDDDRNPLSDEEIAEKKAEAEAVLAELRECAAEDLPERFDALMNQYSEDTGLLSFPDGYYFRSGEMVPSFESAVAALEENGLSELVESDYGFHIIFCPPMSADHIMGYDASYMAYGPRSVASSALFDNIVRGWFAEAIETIMYRDGFDVLDMNALFKP